MALLTKRTPALLVPVQTGVAPPFGYLRDFYSDLKANAAVAAMYDFHADFCAIDGANGIQSVADSLGKAAPLTLVSGATPAVLTDAAGGAGDFSVGTGTAASLYQGPAIYSSTGIGMLAVFTLTDNSQQVIASFGGAASNIWFNGAPGMIQTGSPSPYAPVPAFRDGRAEWVYSLRTPTEKRAVNEAATATDASTLPATTNIIVGGSTTALAFANRFKSLLHALLILKDAPDTAGEALIMDWVRSITPAR